MRDTTVHTVLSTVETLDANACGALTVDVAARPVGTVFVECKQVCWAVHLDLNQRLRDLLEQHSLVSLDFVKTSTLRTALKQHTVESLLAFPQDQGETFGWVPHRYQGYHPRFTFSPAEILVAVNSMLYETEAAGAELDLAYLDVEVRAASFVPADDDGLIAVRIAGPHMSIRQLDELGEWAEAAFAVTRGFPRDILRRSVEAATGDVWLAWRTSRRHTCAAVLQGGTMLHDLVAKLQKRELPIVISRRPAAASRTVRDDLGAVDRNP